MIGDPDVREPDVDPTVGLVRDFVNTVEWQLDTDQWATAADLAAWLTRRTGVAVDSASNSDYDLARRIREGLRSALLANAGHAALDSSIADLNSALEELPLQMTFAADGSAAIAAVPVRSTAMALGRVLGAVDELRAGGRWGRLKACARDSCRWAYWDSSRNGAGRWCSMAGCGNAVKMGRRDGRDLLVIGAAGTPRAATLVDVAGRAGVSIKTVSNVVTGASFVATQTRLRVERAIAELDYRPNLAARALRTGSADPS